MNIRHEMQAGQKVPQVGVNPVVLDAPLVKCVGGPCDADEMRCPIGYVLENNLQYGPGGFFDPEAQPMRDGYAGGGEFTENMR